MEFFEYIWQFIQEAIYSAKKLIVDSWMLVWHDIKTYSNEFIFVYIPVFFVFYIILAIIYLVSSNHVKDIVMLILLILIVLQTILAKCRLQKHRIININKSRKRFTELNIHNEIIIKEARMEEMIQYIYNLEQILQSEGHYNAVKRKPVKE
jgi:hypothetical protein